MGLTDKIHTFYITVEADEEEISLGDNSVLITKKRDEKTLSLQADIVYEEKSGNNYKLLGNFKNNTSPNNNIKAVFALYGAGDELLDMKIRDLTLDIGVSDIIEETLTTNKAVVNKKVYIIENQAYAEKPSLLIQGKEGVVKKYGTKLKSDSKGNIKGNGVIDLALNQSTDSKLITYVLYPYKSTAVDALDGYGSEEETLQSAVAFGQVKLGASYSSDSAATIRESILLKRNIESGDYVLRIIQGNGISSANDNNVVRYLYTHKSSDLNKDGNIDILDLAQVAKDYNIKNQDSKYNINYDLNSDGIIDIYDLSLLLRVANWYIPPQGRAVYKDKRRFLLETQ